MRRQLARLRNDLADPAFLQSIQLTRDAFDGEWITFERAIGRLVKAPEIQQLAQTPDKARWMLNKRLRYLFYAQVFSGRFSRTELENQKAGADLRHPAEWFPATRQLQRTVHLHVGPTNSGKTYHALKRLEEAESGVYLGPLRLLAHEVYSRMNAKGKPCTLVTGEEQRIPEGSPTMWSCTVEMAPLNVPLDVAVIDEIQMINHKERGWAWTMAFLGVRAKEIHLCGEARTVPLIRELCALTGDNVHVHDYERLTPLKLAPKSLDGNLSRLQKGDCVVSFSVLGIHALRRDIEMRTNRKCAIVYGSLPPETRAQQARLFNDPDNDYDFLVASDAIGMGLNLSIKRIIFESTVKNNGTMLVPLQVSEIKQIAGRAGRYRSAHQAIIQAVSRNAEPDTKSDPAVQLDGVPPVHDKTGEGPGNPPVGLVTTLHNHDYALLKWGMTQEAERIRTAGLFPPSIIIERFARYFPPGTPFSYVMLRLHEIANSHDRFFLCSLRDQLDIADAIHVVQGLSIPDRITICAAPAKMKDVAERKFLLTLAECIAQQKHANLLELPYLPLETLDKPPSAAREYLADLERLHKMLLTYLWLSYRFPSVIIDRRLASHVKELVEDTIERTLTAFAYTQNAREAIRRWRQQAKLEARLEARRKAMEQEQETDVESGQIEAMQPEVEDVLHDAQSFAYDSPPTDDEGEYPIGELELELESPEKYDALQEQKHRQNRKHQGTRSSAFQVSNASSDRSPSGDVSQVHQSEVSQPGVQ